ncbi:hypothetical protein [Massilia luteola]|uniref:hypothetical protein n=1 Tax=Massilia luteola TaxID=3081751 RepID=UPI002ACC0381|nr:hypothetical protein [Massilia sp. Gc5]
MPQLRITDYFRPVTDPGPSSPAPDPAPARAPRAPRGGTVAPELQARAPQPYATGTLNRDHARVDLGAKFAAFSERMRCEQAPPAPAYVLSHTRQPAPQYVLDHMTQPAPAAGPSSATPPQPQYVLSHMTQPAPAPTDTPAPATPPQPLYVLSHMTQPAPPPASEPAPTTPQAHAPRQPLYYLNHNPNPVYADPFARENRHSYFAGRMTDLLTGLPNRFLPRRRRNGGV